ncbi:WG repeat-containing protein [Emticicia sp.]|uniref:WG repeat-containing protein n=1 Tax=Emticicia sp. TaxID=1930953 RepID=UPI0037536239
MKKFSIILFLLINFVSNTFAQVVQAVSMSPKDSTGGFAKTQQQFVSGAVARKSVISYAKNSMSQFEDNRKKTLPKEMDSLLVKQDYLTHEQFPNYLTQIENAYKRELEIVNKITIDNVSKLEQASQLNKTYSVSQSGQCFSEKEKGSFLLTQDDEGKAITGFSLETLKGNPRYGLIDNYHQGYARVKKDMVFGFLNLCGEEVIPAQYDYAEPFNDGRALVKKFFWHFVNAEGIESEVLTDIIDAKALKFGVSLAKFKSNKFALIDNSYDSIKKPISAGYDEIEAFIGNIFKVRNGKLFGLIKIDGSSITDITFDKITLSEANRWIIVEQNKKVGLIDSDGNTRIKPSYDYIRSVTIDPSVSPTAASVIAKDASGIRLIELNERKLSETYATIGDFNRFGLAPACKSIADKGTTKCGYISFDGTEVIPPIYDEVQPFNVTGLAVVTEKATNCSKPVGNCLVDIVYDRFGRIVIDKVNPNAPEGIRYMVTDTILASTLVVVRTNSPTEKGNYDDGYNLIDKNTLKRFTTEAYKNIRKFDRTNLAMLKGDKWGLLDFTGKEVLTPSYNELLFSSEGLIGVKYDNNKYGFIDKKGKVQITFEYSEINQFKNGMAIVSKGNNKVGIINKFNAKIAPCLFKSVRYMEDTSQYELSDTSNNLYNLNSGGDCISANSAKFYDLIRKANQK